jgi:hypothetical protein
MIIPNLVRVFAALTLSGLFFTVNAQQDYVRQIFNKPQIDVREPPYRVKCDGTTDDAPNIQAAINAAATSPFNGAVLIFPSGNCIFGGGVTLSAGVELRGQSVGTRSLSASGTTFTAANSLSSGSLITGVAGNDNTVIRQIQFIGNNLTGVSAITFVAGTSGHIVENVEISGFRGRAINLPADNSRIESVTIWDSDDKSETLASILVAGQKNSFNNVRIAGCRTTTPSLGDCSTYTSPSTAISVSGDYNMFRNIWPTGFTAGIAFSGTGYVDGIFGTATVTTVLTAAQALFADNVRALGTNSIIDSDLGATFPATYFPIFYKKSKTDASPCNGTNTCRIDTNVELETITISADYTLTSKLDKLFLIDSGSNPITVNMPVSPKVGQRIEFKVLNSDNLITFTGGSFDGQASFTPYLYQAGTLICTGGTNWAFLTD